MKWLNNKKIIGWGIRCWRICIDLFIIGLGVYSIHYGVFDIEYLIRCIKVLLVLLVYWYVAYNIGMGSGSVKDFYSEVSRVLLKKNFNFLEEEIELTQRYRNLCRFKSFAKKYSSFFIYRFGPYGMRIYSKYIRIVIYLMPWMWFYLFLCFFAICLFYIRVVLNGVIDIFLKKYFDYYWDKSVFSYENRWWYIMFIWVIKYPILRFLFYPLYIRIRVINKDWKDLVRIRFIAYFYAVYLVFLGYENLIYYLKIHYLLLFIFIYVYFAILFPIILYFINKIDPWRYEIFLCPSIFLLHYAEKYTVTLFLLNKFFIFSFWPDRNSWIYTFETGRFGIFKAVNEKIIFLNRMYLKIVCRNWYYLYNKLEWPNTMICYYGDDNPISNKTSKKFNYNLYTQKNLWKYEKYYFVPCFFYKLFFVDFNFFSAMIMLEAMWQEGIARYGVMFMHYEYGDAYEQTLDLFTCVLFFIFDLQRICGIKFDIKGDLIAQLFEFKMELSKDDVPLKFALLKNLKLYKDVLDIINFFFSKQLLFSNGGSYIPEIFSARLACFYDLYENPDDYEMLIKKFVPVIAKNIEINKMSLSLVDRLELLTPGIFKFYKHCFSDLVDLNKSENTEFIYCEDYKFYLQDDFIKAVKSDYDKLVGSEIDVYVSKNVILEYKQKCYEKDKFSNYQPDDILFYILENFVKSTEVKHKLKTYFK